MIAKRHIFFVTMTVVSACSNDASDRVTATALMGGGLGVPAGPIGVAIGAGIGAVSGSLIPVGVLEGSARSR
jgi:uncharacterized membrane protein